ncbi:hypothetical protein YC2023_070466 [Brassica napus]
MVNIGTHDLAEGWPHLVLGLISQLIKFQLLAHLSLKKMPQLIELVVRTTKRTSEITPGENLTQMVELPSLESEVVEDCNSSAQAAGLLLRATGAMAQILRRR